MNEKEALKKFEAELKARKKFIEDIKNERIRMFKIIFSGSNSLYNVSSRSLEEEKKYVKRFIEEAESFLKRTGRKPHKVNFEIEIIKEA